MKIDVGVRAIDSLLTVGMGKVLGFLPAVGLEKVRFWDDCTEYKSGFKRHRFDW